MQRKKSIFIKARFVCNGLNVGWSFSLRLAGTPPYILLLFFQPSHYLHFLALAAVFCSIFLVERSEIGGIEWGRRTQSLLLFFLCKDTVVHFVQRGLSLSNLYQQGLSLSNLYKINLQLRPITRVKHGQVPIVLSSPTEKTTENLLNMLYSTHPLDHTNTN